MNSELQIYTISELNATARALLEERLPLAWVTGEISNLSRPSSGHIYFSLKDEFAQVRCAMFRYTNNNLNFTPENGLQVLAQTQVSIYEARGDYQLIIQHMEPAGEGLLRQKFEQLKIKLQTEGLFKPEYKQPLPKFPKKIGVITSPTGAAVRDIIQVLRRRFPSIPIIIYPTQVQGNEAKEQIAHAINIANQHDKCEVLIIARGGGSLENLWPFNEEIVARAIFSSQIPIISGVGHETDFTIADFVADLRAPTPSAAAELAVPDATTLLNMLQQLLQRLQHPLKKLQNYAQQLDNLEQRLNIAIKHLLKHKQSQLTNLSRALETISPLATLNRGYAILSQDNQVIASTADVKISAKLHAKLKDGSLICTVDKRIVI